MKKTISLLLALALCAGLLAGCGNSDPAPSGDQGSAQPQQSQQAQPSDGGDDAYLEEIRAIVEASKGSTPAQFEGPTEKTGAPPQGIKIAVIPSDGTLAGCTLPCYGVMDAVEHIDGWESQYFDGGGDASSQNAAILSAISWGADVIVCIAIDPRNVQQGIQEAKNNDILICCGSNGIMDPNPELELEEGQVNFEFDVAPNYYEIGVQIASWIINDCNNDGSIVVFGDQEFPSNMAVEVGLLDALHASDMEVSDVQYFTGSEVGDTLNRQLVSYLTEHPETEYVFSPFDPAAASMVEGLNQAGMTEVKLVSILGISQNIELIRAGDIQCADGVYDNTYMGWAIVDQCIRYLNGKDLAQPMGENLPYGMVDADNLPPEGESWTADFDYQSEFLSLWTD